MNIRSWGTVVLLLAGLVLSGGEALADPQLPPRTGAVVDAANIIQPYQEQTLAANASNLKAMSNVELVVVTLPSLQGHSIERWGKELGNGWNVGGSAGRGVLLIVAPNDREVRIEVGDGFPLSNNAAASIVNNVIIPRFRAGEMAGGILTGVDAIVRSVTGPEAPGGSVASSSQSGVNWYAAGPLLLLALLGLFVVLQAMRGVLEEGPVQEPRPREYRPDPASVLTKDTSSRSSWFSSSSMWSSSRSSSWSGGGASRSFGSGRSSGGFSGRGASGRW